MSWGERTCKGPFEWCNPEMHTCNVHCPHYISKDSDQVPEPPPKGDPASKTNRKQALALMSALAGMGQHRNLREEQALGKMSEFMGGLGYSMNDQPNERGIVGKGRCGDKKKKAKRKAAKKARKRNRR